MGSSELLRGVGNLDQPLVARFEWGPRRRVAAPGLETRRTILRDSAESVTIRLDETINEFVILGREDWGRR